MHDLDYAMFKQNNYCGQMSKWIKYIAKQGATCVGIEWGLDSDLSLSLSDRFTFFQFFEQINKVQCDNSLSLVKY